jgi:hypothetical protein
MPVSMESTAALECFFQSDLRHPGGGSQLSAVAVLELIPAIRQTAP